MSAKAGVIKKLLLDKDLNEKEVYDVFLEMFKGDLSDEDARTVLLLLAQKGETAQEIFGCLKALRKLEPERPSGFHELMDTCGTGGDQSHSINVSTLSAILIAASGGKVAKHGNRSITSKVGSSDLMEAFGVNLDAPYQKMIKGIKEVGLGYFHAPVYHPIFARVQPLRQRIKARTIFNLLGPLVNPLKLQYQVIGVSRKDYLEKFAQVLKLKKLKKAVVCHSREGMDELSTKGISDIALVSPSRIQYTSFDPQKYGFKKAKPNDYLGGSLRQNLSISKKILAGKLAGPKRDLVAANAGLGLFICGLARSLDQGIEMISKTLDQGKGIQTIQQLAKITQ